MNINHNSARSRRAFLRKAFASIAIGAAGSLSLPAVIRPDDKIPDQG